MKRTLSLHVTQNVAGRHLLYTHQGPTHMNLDSQGLPMYLTTDLEDLVRDVSHDSHLHSPPSFVHENCPENRENSRIFSWPIRTKLLLGPIQIFYLTWSHIHMNQMIDLPIFFSLNYTLVKEQQDYIL